ncbi:MAG: acyl-CoA/acyl-ACP dehydrogenase [Taibaiella sp.]|nr:acyl-CoA/acyl-ACP dehydrogenase [Taibaiella sp.]
MISLTGNFTTSVNEFSDLLKRLFHKTNNIDQFSANRGLPEGMLNEILSHKPLGVAIPEAYGGRGNSAREVLALLTATSYESLPLALTFGINIGLFIGPIAKYADDTAKGDIFGRFLDDRNMGGMMITEPNHGSDALNMQTSYRETEAGYKIDGTKHWQGLTGLARYWLIAARKQQANGSAGRDVDFFICDSSKENQQIVVEEYFDTLGLYMIPYGRNKVDVTLPINYKLNPQTTGINMMLDILHRSRMQFPGMAMGFIKRMLDEATTHCRDRVLGKGNLLSKDAIAFMIARMQSAYTICSAMCVRSCHISGLDVNLSSEGLEANSIKALVTDLMQDSAQTLVQVSGAKGYQLSHIGGRGIVDSRPFQIFEGPNEMLYTQVAEAITRLMKKQQQSNLFTFLESFTLTAKSCQFFKSELSVSLSNILPQRKMSDLGKILSRVMSLSYVIDLDGKGFRLDLIDNCIQIVRQEVAALMATFQNESNVQVIADYESGSSWTNFA